MITDPISDLLTRIRNAQSARNEVLRAPHSNLKEQLLGTLKKNNFIKDFKKVTDGKFPELEITLDQETLPFTFQRVSKPGQRIYRKSSELKVVKNGLGMEVISTSKGLMTNSEAYKAKLGGEVICKVY